MGEGYGSIIMFLLGDAFLLLLALDLAVLLFVIGLEEGNFLLVLLVLGLEAILGGLVNLAPHVTDDLGDFGDLGGGVVCLDAIVDFSPEEEEGRQGSFGSRWLN